jgi:hypothetical protein
MTATTPAEVLLALIRLAGPEGRSSSELRLGVRAISGQEAILAGLEADGLITSKPGFFGFQGKVWTAS